MRKAAHTISMTLATIVAIGSLTACTNGNFLAFGNKNDQQQQKQTNHDVLAYSLDDMDHRVADHTSPDAMVYIAPGYDRTKPIHLVVYNHGMMTNLNDVEKGWQIGKAMKDAAPNTVLFAPEWAVNPSALSDKAGKFHDPNFFRGMLEEAFSKVPELKGRSLNDVKEIRLTSFSGGLYPLTSELERNGLEAKVESVTLFDSLYKGNALDAWLKKNIVALSKGEKQYQNFYFHTWPASLQQMKRVQKMLADAKVDHASTKFDTADAYSVMEPLTIGSKGIVYKYSMAGIDDNTIGHNAVPKTYIPQFLKAASYMGPQGVKLAERAQVKVKRIM
jgi:hypothetical protein